MRLIDADAYAAEMKTRQDACRELIYAAQAEDNEEIYDRQSCAFGVFVEAKLTLDAMPTVDAVPVVRCGECLWFAEFCTDFKAKTHCDGMCENPRLDRCVHGDYVLKNWFCADGERKDG